MLHGLSFLEAFVEIFNVVAALVIIFFCGHIFIETYRFDRSLLKARLFLNDSVMQQTWTSISIAGAAFALNALLKLVVGVITIKDALYSYYMVELTQVIFVMAFIYAVFSWHLFINAPRHAYVSSE